MDVNNLPARDWSDVGLYILGIIILGIIFTWVFGKFEDIRKEEKAFRNMYLTPEEKKKLYEDTNGRINDRNRQIIDQVSRSCENDIANYERI